MTLPNNTVIFDGECGVCTSLARFLIKHDKKKRLWFTTNKSESVRNILSNSQVEHSIFFYQDGNFYKASTAIIKIFSLLPFPYPLLYGFIIIPRPVRDFFYGIVARIRYKISKKLRINCSISPELISRLIK